MGSRGDCPYPMGLSQRGAMTFTVTDEVISLAYDIVEGWYPEGPIDWEDVWDRLDGSELEDGTRLDLGNDLLSPELQQLKRAVQKRRRSP